MAVLIAMACSIASISCSRHKRPPLHSISPCNHTCRRLGISPLIFVSMSSCYLHRDKEPIMQPHHTLLETYLRQLKLPTFAANYATFAQDAARTGLSCERYL